MEIETPPNPCVICATPTLFCVTAEPTSSTGIPVCSEECGDKTLAALKGEVYFFGCWGEAGHFLRDKDGNKLRHKAQTAKLRIPAPAELDTSSLLLPKEVVGDGLLTYIPSYDCTIMAWWGNYWDSRPGVNNSLIARGTRTADEVWDMLKVQFPASLVSKLERPKLPAVEVATEPNKYLVLESVDAFLARHSVLDACNEMDGAWVPVAIAFIAAEKVQKKELRVAPPPWRTG